jgi:hypothetical protein
MPGLYEAHMQSMNELLKRYADTELLLITEFIEKPIKPNLEQSAMYGGGLLFLNELEEQDGLTLSLANEMRRGYLLNPEALDGFIVRAQPYFSKDKIEAFAVEQKRHPGIVNIRGWSNTSIYLRRW